MDGPEARPLHFLKKLLKFGEDWSHFKTELYLEVAESPMRRRGFSSIAAFSPVSSSTPINSDLSLSTCALLLEISLFCQQPGISAPCLPQGLSWSKWRKPGRAQRWCSSSDFCTMYLLVQPILLNLLCLGYEPIFSTSIAEGKHQEKNRIWEQMAGRGKKRWISCTWHSCALLYSFSVGSLDTARFLHCVSESL